MESFFELRNSIINIYRTNDKLINILLKIVLGMILYGFIFTNSYEMDMLSPMFNGIIGISIYILVVLAFSITPIHLSFYPLSLFLAISISQNPILALFVFLILISVIIFYVRLARTECILILLTLISFYLKLPAIFAVFSALYFSIFSIIPVIIGVFIYYLLTNVGTFITTAASLNNGDELVTDAIFGVSDIVNKTLFSVSFIIVVITFVITFIVVYIINNKEIDYNREIAVVVGSLICLIGLSINSFYSTNNLIIVILFTIIASLINLIITFFENVLDYEKTEKVKFQDDEYVYYVKAIPKK